MGPGARSTTMAVALGAALVTLLVSVIPGLDLAYRSETGHVAIETAAAIIAILAAYLVWGHYVRDGELSDLILVGALIVLGVTNLAFSLVPATTGSAFDRFSIWAPVGGRLLAAFGFAIAAVMGPRRVAEPRRALVPLLLVCAALLAALAALFALLAPSLPLGIDPSTSPTAPNRPRIVGNAALLTTLLVTTLFYAVAAVGFVRRSYHARDELLGWFAVASVLAAFANVNYFLFPSLYTEWVYTGDFFRLATYLVLFIGAVRQIGAYQRSVAGAAVLEERRRLARELHDGLAQELAFISTQTRWMADGHPQKEHFDLVAMAAQRALDESRSAIAALTRPLDEPLEVAVAQAAEEVAERIGVNVRLELEAVPDPAPRTRDAVLRLVREAISHTAWHGKATRVTVCLANSGGLRLTVKDDGAGFDSDAGRKGTEDMGLMNMRERVQALGGEFRVESTPGTGTEIQVVIP
jgi:signal transduction histidine kinase